jgi:transcriptional regulator of acetoin/glycerol metabolism
MIAAAIHDMSPRKERPLITVNCADLPGNLIESELFGRRQKNPIRLSTALQSIPQYVEVPPNIEAQRIIS